MFGYYVYHLIILESQKKLTLTVYHNTYDDMIHISGGVMINTTKVSLYLYNSKYRYS